MYTNTPLIESGDLPVRKNTPVEIKNELAVAIGASTPKQLFDGMAPYLNHTLINCCQGGKDINNWVADSPVWRNAMAQIADPSQVTTVYMIHDDLRVKDQSYPNAPSNLADKFLEVFRECEERFPKLKKIVLFNRLYTGWADLDKHKEPAGWNSGWAIKWAIERYDGDVFCEGFDLWTSGQTVRSDGFQVKRNFFKKADGTFDGVHLGERGAKRIGKHMAQVVMNS